MTKSFKAAIYETHGNPAEVLRIVDAARKLPSDGSAHILILQAN